MKITLSSHRLRRNPVLGIAVSGLMIVWLFAGTARAQVTTGTIAGVVKDATGAVVPNTTVTVKQVETGLTRTAVTGASGDYTVTALPIGHYEVDAEAAGFKKEVRSGIELAVSQTAVINLTLEVGAVQQQVTVTGEAPVVNTTTSQTSGEVAPEQVKDLPLNGRSYDQLITLTTGVNNFTENDQRPSFSVSGHRGENNRFLVNGVDLVGQDSSGQEAIPMGSSQGLLGVDAVQEFNVETDTYGAELGKHPAGQINIVTTSGTNNFHGDLFEFLRNTDANAGGYFQTPSTLTTQKRNQFGGSVGGPIVKDKVFFFGAYEGVRQITNTGTTSTIPDAFAQNGLLPNGTPVAGLNPGMLPIVQTAYPNPATYPGGCREITVAAGLPGECNLVGAPTNSVREDFGLTRFDYNISSKDSLAGTYLYDNGNTQSEGLIPTAGSEGALDTQLLSIQETHIFSPEVLNVATLGYSRAWATSSPSPYLLSPVTPQPIPSIDYFVLGPSPSPGSISVGGGVAGGLASSDEFQFSVRNLFTYADDVHVTKGAHDLSFGVWTQRVQSDTNQAPLDTAGGAAFASITTLLQGTTSSFLAVPAPTELGFRSTEYAGYIQDNVKVRHNLTVRLGVRIEGDTGWNEHTGRISNYGFNPDGVMNTNPTIGVSPFIHNNQAFLPQPRVGLAWDPTGSGKWSVRAGFGIYDDLQDDLSHRLMVSPPFNTRLTYTAANFLSLLPVTAASILPQCTAPIVPTGGGGVCSVPEIAGIDPNMSPPITQEWTLSIERELTKNLVLHVGYVGFESYHDNTLDDSNQIMPQVCGSPAGCESGGINLGNAATGPIGTVPQGTTYLPLAVNPATGTADGCRLNCDMFDTQQWFFQGTSSYNALNAFLQQRFSNGIAFRVNYTWEKILDYDSGLLGSENSNSPQDILDFWNLAYDRGIAAYNISQQLNFNFDAALPFGKGRPYANNLNSIMDGFIGGWQFNGIFTAETGFPFTPLLGVNVSGNGDSHLEDVPSINGPPQYNDTVQHYYSNANLSAPLPGTYGSESRGLFTGPGLVDMDLSLFKKFPIKETRSLEFRVESFNIANHPNFGIPNQTAFQASSTGAPVPSATYGQIRGLNGTNRELQFALKFIF